MAKRTKNTDPFLALPKRVRSAIERCRAGETLCRHFRTLRYEGESQDWFFEPSGRTCGNATAEAATRTPFMVPGGDGLFADDSQTFRAAP